jgi:hypothetical protein
MIRWVLRDTCCANVPARHGIQAIDPPGWNVPRGHGSQSLCSAKQRSGSHTDASAHTLKTRNVLVRSRRKTETDSIHHYVVVRRIVITPCTLLRGRTWSPVGCSPAPHFRHSVDPTLHVKRNGMQFDYGGGGIQSVGDQVDGTPSPLRRKWRNRNGIGRPPHSPMHHITRLSACQMLTL